MYHPAICMVDLAAIGIWACLIIFLVILIAFFFIWLVFKFIIYFLPSIIVALLVYLITDGNLGITAVAFILSAIVFAAWGWNRKRDYRR